MNRMAFICEVFDFYLFRTGVLGGILSKRNKWEIRRPGKVPNGTVQSLGLHKFRTIDIHG